MGKSCGMMHHPIGVPACFSSSERSDDDSAGVTRLGQNLLMSVYQIKIGGQCYAITVTWYKNLLLHGLSVSVQGPEGGDDHYYCCKVELKPWFFWRKEGSKRFVVDGKTLDVVWDLKAAKFSGKTEPQSNYYVAIVCNQEVVLLLGDQKKDAFRRTGCRPALVDPILVSRKEHIFGKKKFSTRAKFHEKEAFHEISIECYGCLTNNGSLGEFDPVMEIGSLGEFDPVMEIRIDGNVVVHVKHLQWKFRGNESIHVNKARLEVCWDVHNWLFSPGSRHALFIFKPTMSSTSPSSALSTPLSPLSSSSSTSTLLSSTQAGEEYYNSGKPSGFCLFLYAWKVD